MLAKIPLGRFAGLLEKDTVHRQSKSDQLFFSFGRGFGGGSSRIVLAE